MATERILHPEWRDEQDTTKYPFADAATLTNESGLFLPETLFLDATLYPISGGARLRLANVSVDHQQVTLTLGDESNAELAFASFPLLSPPDNLRLTDVYGRAAGLLVSSSTRLAIFQSWPTGDHSFTVEASEFCATCCVPLPELGVRGILLTDSNELLTGDVWLVGDDGVVLSSREVRAPRLDPLGGEERLQVIRVDIAGDPLFRRKLCEGVFSTARYLQQITVQEGCRRVVCLPDEFGDFKITVGHQEAADTILRIRATEQGLVIEAVGEKLKSIK